MYRGDILREKHLVESRPLLVTDFLFIFVVVTLGGRGLHPGRFQPHRTVDDGAVLRIRPRHDPGCRNARRPNAHRRATGKTAHGYTLVGTRDILQ